MEETKAKRLAIAIARQMGSGGSFIGRKIAERFGWMYLDRQILTEAANRLHENPEALEALDEHHLGFWEKNKLTYAFAVPETPYMPPPLPVDDRDLFDAERTIILEAVERGPVVVVGRAGFHILGDRPGCLSVFLHAPVDVRARRINGVYALGSYEKALTLLERADRDRERFIKSVTGKAWQDPGNYDLCIDTGSLGAGTAIELIYEAARERARKAGSS